MCQSPYQGVSGSGILELGTGVYGRNVFIGRSGVSIAVSAAQRYTVTAMDRQVQTCGFDVQELACRQLCG